MRLLLLLLMAIITSPLRAEDAANSAQSHYEAGDYAQATRLYEQILRDTTPSAALWFNLGNAAWRSDHPGAAIHAWRSAELLAPRDVDIHTNLELARSKRTDQLPAEEDEADWRSFFFWYHSLSLSEHVWLTLLLNLVAWLSLTRWWWRGRGDLPLYIPFFFVMWLAAGGVTVARHVELANHPGAVVLHPEVTARSGTDVGGMALFYLHEGAEVTVEEMRNDWIRIRLPDGRRGWVQAELLGVVGQVPPPGVSP